jgi:hypothetical protein
MYKPDELTLALIDIKQLELENERLKQEVEMLAQFGGCSVAMGTKQAQEISQLKQAVQVLKDEQISLHDYKSKYYEGKKYKRLYEEAIEALRKCSPYLGSTITCNFCSFRGLKHADDCEYVRLTEGTK